VRELLAEAGYRVLEARDAGDASRIAVEHQGQIALLVTDVVMPQMSGRELAERLRPVCAEMKVLYISGYTDDAIAHHGVLEPGLTLLHKPFTPEGLVSKVREMLHGRPRNG